MSRLGVRRDGESRIRRKGNKKRGRGRGREKTTGQQEGRVER